MSHELCAVRAGGLCTQTAQLTGIGWATSACLLAYRHADGHSCSDDAGLTSIQRDRDLGIAEVYERGKNTQCCTDPVHGAVPIDTCYASEANERGDRWSDEMTSTGPYLASFLCS